MYGVLYEDWTVVGLLDGVTETVYSIHYKAVRVVSFTKYLISGQVIKILMK